MPVTQLFDLDGLDLNQVQFDVEDIERINPHRGDMRLLDGIVWLNDDITRGVAFHDATEDAFWVPGHIPGRPLMPGVLMIEAAAQLASFVWLKKLQKQFMAFTRLDECVFRNTVVPGDRLYVLAEQVECRPRRSICRCQGLVNGKPAFEAKITGMPI